MSRARIAGYARRASGLRRASEMLADALVGQARLPHAFRRWLLGAFAVRGRYRDRDLLRRCR